MEMRIPGGASLRIFSSSAFTAAAVASALPPGSCRTPSAIAFLPPR